MNECTHPRPTGEHGPGGHRVLRVGQVPPRPHAAAEPRELREPLRALPPRRRPGLVPQGQPAARARPRHRRMARRETEAWQRGNNNASAGSEGHCHDPRPSRDGQSTVHLQPLADANALADYSTRPAGATTTPPPPRTTGSSQAMAAASTASHTRSFELVACQYRSILLTAAPETKAKKLKQARVSQQQQPAQCTQKHTRGGGRFSFG